MRITWCDFKITLVVVPTYRDAYLTDRVWGLGMNFFFFNLNLVSDLNTTQSGGFQLKWESTSWEPSSIWLSHILLLLTLSQGTEFPTACQHYAFYCFVTSLFTYLPHLPGPLKY